MNLDSFVADDTGKTSVRKKAEVAKKKRARTLVCVLENPANVENVGAVIRNIDALGVTKLYVVSAQMRKSVAITEESQKKKKAAKTIDNVSVGAKRYVYVRYFDTTSECFNHLQKKKFTSLGTSPHIKGGNNFELLKTDFTQFKKLAIWFGNESNGISDEVIVKSAGCIQIEMAGIVESLNLAVSTGIILHYVAAKRREFRKKGDKKQ